MEDTGASLTRGVTGSGLAEARSIGSRADGDRGVGGWTCAPGRDQRFTFYRYKDGDQVPGTAAWRTSRGSNGRPSVRPSLFNGSGQGSMCLRLR